MSSKRATAVYGGRLVSVTPHAHSRNWLFLNDLDTLSKLHDLVAFYVAEHNSRIPHSAFQGQTPDAMYFGTGDGVPDVLKARRESARQARMRANRSSRCATCA